MEMEICFVEGWIVVAQEGAQYTFGGGGTAWGPIPCSDVRAEDDVEGAATARRLPGDAECICGGRLAPGTSHTQECNAGWTTPSPYVVVVSRHKATLEFIARHLGGEVGDGAIVNKRYRDIRVISGNAEVDDVAGKYVIGNIPMRLAIHARAVGCVEFSGTPPRGNEYTLEDMLAAGAKIAGYVVREKDNSSF